jgi:tight adherence protein C
VILVIGALFLVGLSFALIGRAALMRRMQAAEAIETIDAYGYTSPREEGGPARGVRGVVDDIANLIGGLVGQRVGALREAGLRKELMAAGLYTLPPRRFLGYRVLCAATVPPAWLWMAGTSGFPAFFVLVGIFFAVLVGWSAPLVIVRNRARRRLERIDYELPELIDVLVVTVEAGLGFNGSLQVASERLRGPLGDEMRLTLQEQNMGLSTNEALRNMLDRSETPAMRSFVRSIVQGETLGVSIGEIMRNLALEMRKRRRATAEERAQKAPIKLLFPLIFLIFPAMFVVLLGPAIFQFIDAFGS